jgi:excisionase family DNA binding protein
MRLTEARGRMTMTLKVEASAVKPNELSYLEEAAAHMEGGSQLDVYIRGLVAGLRNGADLTTLESAAELSPADAAKVLKMSRTFLMQYIESGELESRKVGSHHRIPLDALLEFRDRVLRGRETVAAALGNAEAVDQSAREDARKRARAARLAQSSER